MRRLGPAGPALSGLESSLKKTPSRANGIIWLENDCAPVESQTPIAIFSPLEMLHENVRDSNPRFRIWDKMIFAFDSRSSASRPTRPQIPVIILLFFFGVV